MPSAATERPSREFRQTRRYKSAAKAFGLRVRSLRLERGWTLDQASEQASLDLKHLQKIEAGILNVTLVTILRLADAFDVTPSALFDTIGVRRKSRV